MANRHVDVGDDQVAIRTVHWNVHSWTDARGAPNRNAVAELLADIEADVVSLVEVDESDPSAPVLQHVADQTGYRSVFVPAFSYGKERIRGCFGNAILTRLPILAVRQHPLLWPQPVYDGTEPSEPRALLLVLVQCGSRTIWIGSVHLPRTLAAARDAALAEFRAVVAALGEPWLVLGDFNTPAACCLTGSSNLAAYPPGPAPTYPADAPRESIDYAITAGHHHVESQVVQVKGSDHLPVTVRLRIGHSG